MLADDHREMIARVRGTLAEEFEIVDAVENGNQAVSAVLALDPDVLVTDISMPFLDGLCLLYTSLVTVYWARNVLIGSFLQGEIMLSLIHI